MDAHVGVAGLVLLVAASLGIGGLAFGQQVASNPQPQANAVEQGVTQGALRVVTKEGGVVECPLKHTDVQARISGFIARVKVTQTFANPLDEKIEAVYVFPLPHKAAVDDMTMVIGERRIVGLIKRRAAAREIYEQALARGAAAALLEQERPNIFTQSVGNIPPRQEIRVEISYLDVLEYDMGTYEFHFPMVVGPRYIPGKPTSAIPPVPPELKGKVGELDKTKVPEGPEKPKGTGWAPDTTRVPDASRITPPVLKPGFRNGHDISLAVWLEAGVPIQDLKVANHKAAVEREGNSRAAIALTHEESIPNKDFVLRYGVVGNRPEMALLCHTAAPGQGYFMLMIQPQEDERLKQAPPRELCFLIDASGSMSGEPIAKVRDTITKFLRLCRPQDTIQLITFAMRPTQLFEKAVPATQDNLDRALAFTRTIQGSGGTEMLSGVKQAILAPMDKERVRIVLMLTDGFVGNEPEIIAEVGRGCGDQIRFWCIGIGSSPNRFLIDGVARQGGGMSKMLGLREDPEPLTVEVMQRITRAQLGKVQVNWGEAQVWETYPAKTPDLWAGRPIVLFGRYDGVEKDTNVLITGEVEGKPTSWTLPVRFPAAASENAVLSKVWARNKIEDLMQQTFYQGSPAVEEEVTALALQYRLMSQYTSFVAVDETEAGKLTDPPRPPRRMLVPVPIPEGTRYEGFFGPGTETEERAVTAGASLMLAPAAQAKTAMPAYGPPPGPPPPPAPPMAAPPRGIYAGRGPATPPLALRIVTASGSQVVRGRASYRGAPAPSAQPLHAWGRGTLSLQGQPAPLLRMYDAERKAEPGARGQAALAWQALGEQVPKLHALAPKALEQAEELHKKGPPEAARARFAWACLLDEALVAMGDSNGQAGAKALAAIEEIDKDLLKGWVQQVPALDKKLDLVIRDKSVAEALDAIGKSAGIPLTVIPGSIEDAAALAGRKDLRVTYLDLRRASVAQGLTWLLVPERMAWWVTKGQVVVGTARRSGTESAWVYDVSHLALPSAKELEGEKRYPEQVAMVRKAQEQFLRAARGALSLSDETCVWFAPGQLLALAGPESHAAAAKLSADLASPDAKVDAALADLHRIGSERAKALAAGEAQRAAAAAEAEAARGVQDHSWPLLAAAASGEVDLEALTHLQVAWKSAAMAELLKAGSIAALRSAWAVAEAARALPKEAELATLAAVAREAARGAADEALAALEKSPRDAAAFLRVTYAALALRDDAAFVSRARRVLGKSKAREPQLATAQRAVDALLVPAGEIDRDGLVQWLSALHGTITGDDLVVLTALACRRADGEAWRAFRAAARDILGNQALDGSVVVLVNRLSAPASPLVARLR